MNTVVYLSRHSIPLKPEKLKNNDSFQIENEKLVLSIEGEKLAQDLSNKEELQNIDLVISSNYARAISTAKYIAKNNNKKLFIDSNFGEREFGIDDFSELPEDFGRRQFLEPEYKIKDGENKLEVQTRMYKELMEVINKNPKKRISIVTHATALLFLFDKWCEISDDGKYKFNGKIFFEGTMNFCETFKLEFNENNELVDIENIK